jgi:hypothetical protein
VACPRELPKRKAPREESEVSEEETPTDKEAPVSRQMKQLLVDCLTTIIRYQSTSGPSSSLSHLSSSVSQSPEVPELPFVGLLPLIYVILICWLCLYHILFTYKNPWDSKMSSSRESSPHLASAGANSRQELPLREL